MHLPNCPYESPRKHESHQLIFAFSIAASSLFLFLLFYFLIAFYSKQKSRRKHTESTFMNELERISYSELVRATNGFSEDNLIGSGYFAKVYKGVLHDDDRRKVVAVKVLNLQLQGASKIFLAECEALRSIRHRNLVKVLTICSSIDFKGDEFKALVLEFMVNGNLDDWLHPKEDEPSKQKILTLIQRLNIAIDMAMAVDYLHNYCETPIIHCDLKPSNILLDEKLTAHVGDFGLARILKDVVSKSSHHSTSSVGLKGTIRYIPPEYGMANRVSNRGDVYSYGILLLQMFTAKSPTDGIFSEGRSLRKFVEIALPQRVTEVIDLQLLSTGKGEETDNGQRMNATEALECITSVLHIGILCSNDLPSERLEMGEVIRELNDIRERLLNIMNPL